MQSTKDARQRLVIELWPVERVRPYPGNPRVITDGAVRKVASSIQEFGFRQPIVVDEQGTVIAGHTRLQAALTLGLKEVPVHIACDMTAAQVRAYRLADNRTHEEARWDDEALSRELAELMAMPIDIDLTGFDVAEIPLPDLDDDEVTGGGGRPTREAREKEPDQAGSASDTKATIGEYRFSIARRQYLEWQERLRQTVGFDQASIVGELKRRLGFGGAAP